MRTRAVLTVVVTGLGTLAGVAAVVPPAVERPRTSTHAVDTGPEAPDGAGAAAGAVTTDWTGPSVKGARACGVAIA